MFPINISRDYVYTLSVIKIVITCINYDILYHLFHMMFFVYMLYLGRYLAWLDTSTDAFTESRTILHSSHLEIQPHAILVACCS